MPSLEIRELKKKYGDVWAVDSVSFSVEDGEFLTLLGPSGCGKTTTLRCIAGLEKIDDGQITIGSRVVSGPGIFVPASQRFLGMVFQSYAIWPHMTVFDNVAFGLKCMNKNLSRELIREKTMQALKMVSLENLEHRQATDISGGQQQRVALARSRVYNPPRSTLGRAAEQFGRATQGPHEIRALGNTP
jgi:iron(III) transport system ATP-binding protein